MSFWKRIFGKGHAEPPVPEVEVQAPAPPRRDDAADSDEAEAAAERERKRLERLRSVGRSGGADVAEAIAILRQHEGHAHQTRYLDAIIEGLSQEVADRQRDESALDPLRVACASLLDERGQRSEALRLVSMARSVPAMMLAAELNAAGGNLARALSMVERVLARDIDTPGARERHERWSAQLGRKPRGHVVNDSATVVAPAHQQSAFRLIREVARGGAGTIYEAEDELLGRRVAYKVYHSAAKSQIEREAQSAVRLTGPCVLRIYDVDVAGGWLAAEWLPHGSLRDALAHDRIAGLLPLDPWMLALLAALERVHGEGLVHGDLKPANILFRDPSSPVLSDFGLCCDTGATALAGTPGYMSPERIDGAPADPRDDVYAIGRIIEDVLGARDDAGLLADALDASEGDARRWARIALWCMDDVDARPGDAGALRRRIAEHERG